MEKGGKKKGCAWKWAVKGETREGNERTRIFKGVYKLN